MFDSVWGVINPPERNTAWNKGRKCFHWLGAPNNLIRPWPWVYTVIVCSTLQLVASVGTQHTCSVLANCAGSKTLKQLHSISKRAPYLKRYNRFELKISSRWWLRHEQRDVWCSVGTSIYVSFRTSQESGCGCVCSCWSRLCCYLSLAVVLESAWALCLVSSCRAALCVADGVKKRATWRMRSAVLSPACLCARISRYAVAQCC